MRVSAKTVVLFGLFAALTACNQHRMNEYYEQRPPVDTLQYDDRGLQSKDVTTASDQMARDLLADAGLRQSNAQWTMVTDQMEDHTVARDFAGNYDIFIQRLRTNLGLHGKGAVTLIQNKARINQLRNKELDGGGADMGRIQPDYVLHGAVYDLPNRGTNYYLLQFDVTNFKTGAIVWSNKYEVKTAR